MPNITINQIQHTIVLTSLDPTMPLLWYLRDHLGLKGAKFGCGIGQCGACTIHVNNKALRSCTLPIGAISEGDQITTIEGLATAEALHPVQRAWVEADVPQCGYCQAGQIMAVIEFLENNPIPTNADIDTSLSNLCRCGTYTRIRKAIHLAAEYMRGGK